MNKLEILDILNGHRNPMWSVETVLRTWLKIHGLPSHDVDSNHRLYRKMLRTLTALEKLGLLYTFRHVNQGTTYLLKSRVKTLLPEEILPF